MSYGYVERMLEYLTSAYIRDDIRNAKKGLAPTTSIGKLFSVLGWGLELTHENFERIRAWDDLDNAEGVVLDRYGKNFGVKRGGADDAFYRLMIEVKLISMLSGGDIDTVIEAAATLLDVDVSQITLKENFPAKVILEVDQDLLTQGHIDLIAGIADSVKRILTGGVGLRLYLRTYRQYKAELPISHGGFVGSYLSGNPKSEQRSVRDAHGHTSGVLFYTHLTTKRIE